MSDHERNIDDDAGLGDSGDAVVRPETIRAKVNFPPVTLDIHDAHHTQTADNVDLTPPTVVVGAGTLTVALTGTARGEVTKTGPEPTTVGIETEYARTIRYSADLSDGIRYVEVVDGNGDHIVSGMGEAADALVGLLEYLLPADHPEYPTDMG